MLSSKTLSSFSAASASCLVIFSCITLGAIDTARAVTFLPDNVFVEDGSGAYLWHYGKNDADIVNAGTVFLSINQDTNAPTNTTVSAGWNYGNAAPPDDEETEVYSPSGSAYDEHIGTNLATQLSSFTVVDGYYVLLLDINESGNVGTMDLKTLDVYLTDSAGGGAFSYADWSAASPNFSLTGSVDPDYPDNGTNPPLYTLTDYSGTSRWDLAIMIPDSDVSGEGLGTDTSKYVHVYAEFEDDSGGGNADKFGYSSALGNLPPEIPEPSSSLLVSLGGLLGLLRRRR